ncbi:MAG: thiamine pyrophosphate-dependent dehydrogenase E1 component subunit alpha [Bdellovibrionaceae bacterium]|jgi:TPP-dependent pyruvate/acetoin dehydrogenase alpha subunit|nr:thiamine pyrophosphate-dependent dehydrogenase E1 component subunit alpha [Pseudobdellovibrionaceae bacterium]
MSTITKSKDFKDYSLGSLEDPLNEKFKSSINLDGENKEQLLFDYKQMLLIRKTEEKISEQLVAGEIKCPCHLAIGQEAIPVGISRFLRKSDRVFGTHRSHGHFIAIGGTAESLFAEVLGKASGCSKGFGGSMHLYGKEFGFYGSVPIVGATISLAVGAGLAAQMDKKENSDMGVCYFGDGAAEEGTLHESLNFASIFNIPVLFVCENNLFSSHLHISQRQPKSVVGRYADAHDILSYTVDGNDLVAVSQAAQALIDNSRNGGGPGFLEVVTYRWKGHVGPQDDMDVGIKRGEALNHWKKRDPIRRLSEGLIKSNLSTEGQLSAIQKEVDQSIQQDWESALQAPYPEKSTLLSAVYSQPSPGGKNV